MIPMTIHDFEWRYFCETYRNVTWYECAAYFCFALAWFFLINKTRKSSGGDVVSGRFLILTIVGSGFAIAYKLLHDLDVRVFWYVFLAIAAFVEIAVCGLAQEREFNDMRRAELLKRAEDKGHKHSHRRHRSSEGHSHSEKHEGRLHHHRHSSREEQGENAGEMKNNEPADDLKSDSNAM